MQSNLARALPLVLCLWLPSAALAQAQEPEIQEPQSVDDTASKAEEQAPPAPEADAKEERSPHDYRPSEDISEDRAVSFPVDI